MSERSKRIFKLKTDRQSRQSYVFSKISVLVPSQIKALRLTSPTPTQKELAAETGAHQSRLSTLEKPGAANVTLETLAWVASVHKVGLVVKFVPLSEMLQWENSYSQDALNVTRLDADEAFLNPGPMAEVAAYNINSAEESFAGLVVLSSPRKTKSGGTKWPSSTGLGHAFTTVKNYDGTAKVATDAPVMSSLKKLQLVGHG